MNLVIEISISCIPVLIFFRYVTHSLSWIKVSLCLINWNTPWKRMESGRVIPHILIIATRWKWVVSIVPPATLPPGKRPCPPLPVCMCFYFALITFEWADFSFRFISHLYFKNTNIATAQISDVSATLNVYVVWWEISEKCTFQFFRMWSRLITLEMPEVLSYIFDGDNW
jgi:hypothetical protein